MLKEPRSEYICCYFRKYASLFLIFLPVRIVVLFSSPVTATDTSVTRFTWKRNIGTKKCFYFTKNFIHTKYTDWMRNLIQISANKVSNVSCLHLRVLKCVIMAVKSLETKRIHKPEANILNSICGYDFV